MNNLIKQKLEKYERYISNLQWHLDTNKPDMPEREKVDMRIDLYKEIVIDLQQLLQSQ